MKKAPASSPAARAVATARAACSVVIRLSMSCSTRSLPDSMPKYTRKQPPCSSRRAVASSKLSTRARHSQRHPSRRRSICSQISATRPASSVNTSSANEIRS